MWRLDQETQVQNGWYKSKQVHPWVRVGNDDEPKRWKEKENWGVWYNGFLQKLQK